MAEEEYGTKECHCHGLVRRGHPQLYVQEYCDDSEADLHDEKTKYPQRGSL